MTHIPAVDSLEQVIAEIRQCRSIMGTVADDLMDAWANRLEALTRPPGGSERLRELIAKWRYPWQKNGAASEAELARDQCADELESALASPQGAEQRQEAVPYGWLEPETGNFVDHATKLAMPFDASTYTLAIFTAPVRHSCETDMLSDCPGCNAEHDATPHPAQAASQGDAESRFFIEHGMVHDRKTGKHLAGWSTLAESEALLAALRELENDRDAWRMTAKAVDATALSSPTGVQAAQVSDARADGIAPRDRLWDSQWVNIVNHANCYRDMDKEEAVACAVKLTEQAMAANLAKGSAAHGGEVAGWGLFHAAGNRWGTQLFPTKEMAEGNGHIDRGYVVRALVPQENPDA